MPTPTDVTLERLQAENAQLRAEPSMEPATPLPWLPESRVSVVKGRALRYAVIVNQDGARVALMGSSKRNHQDNLYSAHAANAYPKLVAALRLMADRFIPDDVAEHQRQSECEALLRELGEDAICGDAAAVSV